MTVHPSITFLELKNTSLQRIGQQSNKHIMQVFYRVPMVSGKGVLRYRSWQLNSDNDVGLMFTFHAQFLEIWIIELFIVLEESHFSSGGSASDAAYVPMLQPMCSPTFAMVSLVENENMDDLMSGPSFHQMA